MEMSRNVYRKALDEITGLQYVTVGLLTGCQSLRIRSLCASLDFPFLTGRVVSCGRS
jgi:hypothetical protein